MRYMTYGILPIILVFFLFFCGCSTVNSPEDEKLLNKARESYGSCELAGSEVQGGERICRIKDSRYGFEYEVRSQSASPDEISASNYIDVLRNYVINDASAQELRDICTQSGCTLSYEGLSDEFIVNVAAGVSEEETAVIAGRVADVFKEYPSRTLLSMYVRYSDSAGNQLGAVSLGGGTTADNQKSGDMDMLQLALSIEPHSSFVRTETKKFSETGLTLADVSNPVWDADRITSPDDEVTFYYFDSLGREYFIADFYTAKQPDKAESFYSNYQSVLGIS